MSIRCEGVYLSIIACCQSTKRIVVKSLLTLNEIRRNPDPFQKTCLVALSAIRALNDYRNTHYLPELLTVLDAAPAFDFYPCFRLPSCFLHPYRAERFDEYHLLDQIEVILCKNWRIGVIDDQEKNRDSTVRKFAKKELAAFLDWMIDQNADFGSEKEIQSILQNWFKNKLEAAPQEGYIPGLIDFSKLEVVLKSFSILEKISMLGLIFADIVCVPDFLQTWGVIDLAPFASAVGALSFFSWVPNQNLGDWVWRGLCTGFVFQCLQAAQTLSEGNLSSSQAKEAGVALVASIAESVLCISNLLKWNDQLINGLALIAKSMGVIVFLMTSKPVFFAEKKGDSIVV